MVERRSTLLSPIVPVLVGKSEVRGHVKSGKLGDLLFSLD